MIKTLTIAATLGLAVVIYLYFGPNDSPPAAISQPVLQDAAATASS